LPPRLEWRGGGIISILLDAQKTGGQLTMLRSALPAGAASAVHVHADEEEVVLLIRGSGVFWAGQHRYELSDGGVAYLPRKLPHAYLFTSETVDMLGLCIPAGGEEFFRAAGARRCWRPASVLLTRPVLTSGNRSGPRWSMALAVGSAAEIGGA
jgi:quercetin dioxygenase-like cupin family protein